MRHADRRAGSRWSARRGRTSGPSGPARSRLPARRTDAARTQAWPWRPARDRRDRHRPRRGFTNSASCSPRPPVTISRSAPACSGNRPRSESASARSPISTAALNFGRSAISRAVQRDVVELRTRCSSTSVAASVRSRCSSASVSRGHPGADEVDGGGDRQHRQQRAGEKDAIGDRAEDAHQGTTRSTSAHPPGGTTTERVTRASPSYQPTSV